MAKDEVSVDDQLAGVLEASDAPEPNPEDERLSEEQLAGLTEHERDAYLAAIGEDDEADGKGEDDGTTPAPDTPAPAPEPEPAAAEGAAALRAEVERLTGAAEGFGTRHDELIEQYDNGDLSEKEYREKQTALRAEEREVVKKLGSAESRFGQLNAADDQAWATAANAFLDQNPALRTQDHFEGFNAVVERVSTDPEIAALPFDKLLAYARDTYATRAAAIGQPLPAATPTAGEPGAAKAGDAARKGERPAPPPTLAGMPSELSDPHSSNVASIAARLDAEEDPLVKERIMASIPEHLRDEVLSYG